jgi:FkbM family methyltransferase
MLVSRLWRRSRRPLRTIAADVLAKVRPVVEVAVGPDKIMVNLRDPIIARNLFLDREYDRHVFEIIGRLDLANKTCVDVGANVGLYSVMLSRMTGPGGRVVALEPETTNFELLQRNRELNGAANIQCVKVAVGAECGKSTLAVNPYNWGDHWITGSSTSPAWASRQSVDVVTLDDQLRDEPDGRLAFIKLDVQGQEVAVLDGMAKTLARNPDVILLVEISPDHLRTAGTSATVLVRRLLEIGFRGWDIQPNRLTPVATPESYEMMRAGLWADLLLCRTPELIGEPVQSLFRAP